ncbi:bacteriocin [Vineibacter terrae]|uniref:Bacteriocin n=1 Tax=Vineibacter terrae TaxID=2586908 RepID=A0A5C8PH32_9HYPH|nr:family 1 encapsulin nanocompartment shell protein [Vineibacter terrae]TXL72501.1 bacteriocin [Vineibacter terrae]
MNHLLRELAPISTTAWQEIENEAKRTLSITLAARRLVDFVGPQGWSASAVGTGRTEHIARPADGVDARIRQVQPLVELRVPFELRRSELDMIERGAKDFDTDPVIDAARAIAIAEDRAIFHGYHAAGIRGICQAQADVAIPLGEDYENYPVAVATALNKLRNEGVGGPYAIALSERYYTDLTESTKGGYPVLEHVRKLVDGPLIWAPGLDGGLVMSTRGEDFELTVGQDFSIGYLDHNAERVRLYIEESFTFRVLSPQAAIPLAYGAPPR